MVLGAVLARPDHTHDQETISDPRWDVVQLELLTIEEVIKDDKECTDYSHEEWLVSDVPLDFVNGVNGVGEHAAAQWDQVSVYACYGAAKGSQVR